MLSHLSVEGSRGDGPQMVVSGDFVSVAESERCLKSAGVSYPFRPSLGVADISTEEGQTPEDQLS